MAYGLDTDFIKAEFDGKGSLGALLHKRTGTSLIHGGGGEAWRMVLCGPGTAAVTVGSAGQAVAAEEERDGLRLVWEAVTVDGKRLPIRVEAHVAASGEALSWEARVANRSDLTVESFEFPILSGVRLEDPEAALYRPFGAGERIAAPHAEKEIKDLQYPPASMQWFGYATTAEGLYFGSHDASFESTGMATRPEGGALRLSFTKLPFLKPGETWASAPFVTAVHQGGWRAGARRYRAWADSWFRRENPPRWTEEVQGWFLVILKQQNDAVMWTYKDLPAMLDFARKSGLGMVGAFGWGIGGHDHLYPDYSVAPELGTVEDLKASIRALHGKGGRVILYTNGQLIDTVGDYYREVGKRIAAKDREGKELTEHWHKFSDHSGYAHAIACPAVPEWGDKLVELALYVEGLGADGIIFDQIGAGSRGRLCFDPAHGHRTPAAAMGPAIVGNMARVRAAVKARNPDFCLVTEHVGDATCQCIDWIHGSGFAMSETPTSFPSLFRYAFPEYRFTNRQASAAAPWLSFRETGYAAVHGFDIDLECRYPADAALVRRGRRPRPEDYANVLTPPKMEVVVSGPIEEYREYLVRLLALRAGNPLLRRGVFRDEEGLPALPEGVVAKRFDLGDETAVAVWNAGSVRREICLSLPDMRPVGVLHPEAGASGNAVAADRLAFFLFRRAP